MKVVLVNPQQPELLQPSAYIPLGIAYLAAVLEQRKVDVEVLNLAKPQKEYFVPKADWYGVTCNSATIQYATDFVSVLRRVYKPKIAVGGVHATVAPEQTQQLIGADVTIRGEAERLFADIITGDKTAKPIMDAGIIEYLDSLPYPARHLFERSNVVDVSGIHGQEKGVPATTVITSRGCPYSCNFCCKRHPMFKVYRFRSAKNVYWELKQLQEDYGIEHVRFVDDEFTLNRERTIKLCKTIKGLGISWVCITRADSLATVLLEYMKIAGCMEVHVGVETGSNRLLKIMNKQTTREELLRGIRLIKEAGLRAKAYLMYDFPGETESDRTATLDFLKEAQPDKFTLSRFTPLPGSRFSGRSPGWFYPDEQDHKYLEYKRQIMDVLKQ